MFRLLILSLGLASLATVTAAKDAGQCRQRLGEKHTVVRVLDAATVLLDDATEVRISGIIPPEPPLADGPATPAAGWPYLDAAKVALEALAANQTIALPAGARKLDRGLVVAVSAVIALST